MISFRKLIWLVVIVLGFGLTGCAYVNTKTPFDTDLEKTDLGTKVGTAETYSLLWLVAWGDASYAAAARDGGITVLKHADQETFQVLLGLYTRIRVIVYGD
ncbi:MAG: hypothetical protein C4519_03310 [Desulfobacteraceae bacterium]|nr:MAG: hypothetical protein C4519_03310 [Desulfobacteraceae bacterium]